MAKVSKAGKARLKRATLGEKAAIRKAARLLADYELITAQRWAAIIRTARQG